MKTRTDVLCPFFGVVTLILGLWMGVTAATAEIVVEDNFETRGSGRQEGRPLQGTSTPMGGVEWRSAPADNSGVIFSGKGSVTTGAAKSCGASVPVPDGAKEIRVVAELRMNETAWVGLALGGDLLDGQFFSSKGAQVFSILRPGGTYSIFANGAKQILLGQATLKGKPSTEFTQMELTYKITEDRLTVRFDDKPVLTDVSLAENGYVPGPITRAGLRFNGPPVVAGSPEVRNFKVTVLTDK